MSKETKGTGLSRRDFVKTMGLAGLAAGAGASQALAAPPAGAKAATIPKRKLGKTGVEVSILNLGGMFDTINNQLLLKQARKWGVTYWDTAESYGNGLSEEGMGRYFSRNPGSREEIFLVTKLVPKKGNLTARLEKSLKRLKTDHVDLFFIHAICGIEEMTPAIREWAAAMKKAGKFKFFGFSTHTDMENCLAGAAKLDWIDAVMMTYNFRLMHKPKMKAAVAACVKAGIGLVAMKTQGGGPVTCDSEAELKMAGRFLEKGFTDKQARLKAVWENPHIASICSQMPNLTILGANVAAARDLTKLSRGDFESLQEYAQETACGYCAGCGRICMTALNGAVPVNEVMRCLMYRQDYGEPELARLTFAGLAPEVRERLATMDFTPAELACPQGLPIAQLMRQATEMLA
ncbi:MAG: aldo/keto reductase [Syntrophales bacterium]|nr:aldo/keto reductase [Syntrophales bacterium]MDD5643341.1 aldo/keto reductase [Syntrophales bacterium]